MERQLQLAQSESRRIEEMPSEAIIIPPMDEIKAIVRQKIESLAIDNPEYGTIMKSMIPKIVVFPFRLCDGGHVVLRARFRIHVSKIIPNVRVQEALQIPP